MDISPISPVDAAPALQVLIWQISKPVPLFSMPLRTTSLPHMRMKFPFAVNSWIRVLPASET